MAMAKILHTPVPYFLEITLDELLELEAETAEMLEREAKHGG